MARLLKVERHYLDEFGIEDRWILYCKRRGSIDCSKSAMRRANKWLLHGFHLPCECGSTLTGSDGTCLICHPKKLEKIRPYIEYGYVYLAYVPGANLVKVGETQDIDNRLREHRSAALGGHRSWKLREHLWVPQRGLLEQRMLAALKPYRSDAAYAHFGRLTKPRELFEVNIRTAAKIFYQTFVEGSDSP